MSGAETSPFPADDAELTRLARRVGPVLFMRGATGDRLSLAAILVRPADEAPPVLATPGGGIAPVRIFERYGLAVSRYAFELTMGNDAWYEVEGTRYPVAADLRGDMRVGFVSCNGQEEGDRERPEASRNVLWSRLCRQHDAAPLNLLLQGGDQIYADEVFDVHPVAQEWSKPTGDAGADKGAQVPAITDALSRALFQRYLELYGQPEPAYILARVPSLAMWDDHDIHDGWGSVPDEKLDSPVGQAVFALAREHFMLFQLGAGAEPPETCPDRTGTSLGWRVELPGLSVIAPDLRSERRRERVMGPKGWESLETALETAKGGRVLLVSSVPALGPRLSVMEAVLSLWPVLVTYEDDLRDQWQSRTHRNEWRRFLTALLKVHETEGRQVTVVSGEIHLATRGTLASSNGPLHQLVASGITHPPPPEFYARFLGGLAKLGLTPLPRHRIGLHPLPGRATTYTAQRNYLMLAREDGRWRTWWELEDGATEDLALG